jgi:hypothetical protein
MPWHMVVIPQVEGAFAFGHDLIRAFLILYKAAGRPTEVTILHDRNDAGDHRYYFSPEASTLAPDVLHAYNATVCSAPADVEGLRRVPLEDA